MKANLYINIFIVVPNRFPFSKYLIFNPFIRFNNVLMCFGTFFAQGGQNHLVTLYVCYKGKNNKSSWNDPGNYIFAFTISIKKMY